MARRLYEELGDLSGQATLTGNLGIAAYFEGRWNDAIRLYEESRDNHLKAGNEVQAAIWSANIAEVLINQGKMAAAEALLTEAVPTLAAAGLDSLAFAEVQMGRVLASRGELTEAMTMIGRALDHIKEMGQSITAITATVELASSLVSAGRLEEAIDKLGGAGARSSAGDALWGEAPPHPRPGPIGDGPRRRGSARASHGSRNRRSTPGPLRDSDAHPGARRPRAPSRAAG